MENRRWWEDEMTDYILDTFDIRMRTAIDSTTNKNSDVRKALSYHLKNNLNLNYREIGKILGGRSHATMMQGIKKFKELAEKETIFINLKAIIDSNDTGNAKRRFSEVIDVLEATKAIDFTLFTAAINILKRIEK